MTKKELPISARQVFKNPLKLLKASRNKDLSQPKQDQQKRDPI
jgi:hypothetical protein